MATVLLSDPDEQSRLVLAALIEALGHRVVDRLEPGLDAAVIEPASGTAMRLVRSARAERSGLPVICVTTRRRSPLAMQLEPLAWLDKPVLVGPFVRAISTAVGGSRSELPRGDGERLVAA